MSDSTYRDAWATLTNFAQSFAAPIVAILPVLEKVKDAEDRLAVMQPLLADQEARLAEVQQAVVQAQADRQAVLDSIEHDRTVKQDDADRHLAAYREKVQADIDAISAQREQARAQADAALLTLQQQIEARTQEQRELDAAIQQKRLVVAELTGTIQRASHAMGS